MGWCTAQWKRLFLCENYCERVTQIRTSPSEFEEAEEEEGKTKIWFNTFTILAPLGVLFVMKTTYKL